MKTLKTLFNSFTPVEIFYTSLEHITQNTFANNVLKFTARNDGESMLELTTCLPNY